jgi:predicted nucleotidyltransferase
MDPSHLSEEFRDFLKCLNEAGVDYLLIGGHAVAFHGYVRPTTDMDIWISLDKTNAEKAVGAAFQRRIQVEIDGVSANVIGLSDLKENKRASGRNKDLADLDNLP